VVDTECRNGGHGVLECWTRRDTVHPFGVSNIPTARVPHSDTSCSAFQHPAKVLKDSLSALTALKGPFGATNAQKASFGTLKPRGSPLSSAT